METQWKKMSGQLYHSYLSSIRDNPLVVASMQSQLHTTFHQGTVHFQSVLLWNSFSLIFHTLLEFKISHVNR